MNSKSPNRFIDDSLRNIHRIEARQSARKLRREKVSHTEIVSHVADKWDQEMADYIDGLESNLYYHSPVFNPSCS